LKHHYSHNHSKKEIKENGVPIAPIIHFAKRKALAVQENEGFVKELEESKRNSFILLEKETTRAVIELQYQVPLLKMLA
jgi:hypothetical protein